MMRNLLLALLCLGFFSARAGYVPLVLTGFNHDVVANGAGPALGSTTADVDGVSYAFMAPDYNPSASIFPSASLPANGLISSATTPGLTFQLASYSASNNLRIPATGSGTGTGTITLVTPVQAGELYILGVTGSASSTANITVTFTDNTTQVFNNNTFADWFGGTNFAIQGIGRVQRNTNAIETPAGNPRIYQVRLVIDAANFSKSIASITINKTGANGVLNIMGASIGTLCNAAPTAGTTVANVASLCSTETLNLSLTGATAEPGISYQWERSVDGGVTWTDIPGATAPTATINGQTVATRYRAKLVCFNVPATTVTSTSVSVGSNPCYCTPSFTNGCSTWRLTNVSFGPINNSPSSCTISNYTSQSATVTAGVSFPVTTTTNQYCGVGMYVDLNGDGDFNDTDEWLFTDSYSGNATTTGTANITIPGYVLPGSYRFRIIAKWGGGPVAGQACTAFSSPSYGNFHDYTLVVQNNATCFSPSNVSVAGILPFSATLSWNAPPATTPLGYEWKVVAGGNPVTAAAVIGGSVTSPTVTANLGGLTPSTAYSVYIRSGCGPTSNDSSFWYGPVNFTTALAPCAVPAAQPTALVLTPAATGVLVAFNAASPAPDKYLVVRSAGNTPLLTPPVDGTTYSLGGSLGNGTIVGLGNATNISDAGLTPGTTYTYTIYSVNDLCFGGPLYNSVNPLIGTTTTSAGGSVYSWNGAVSTVWSVPGNWTPARVIPDTSDILQFNSGNVHTVTAVPTQQIRRLVVSNNTTANFQAGAAATLTLASDNNAATNELDIAAGAALVCNGTTANLTLNFAGTGATGNVAGRLEVTAGGVLNTVNFANSVTTVAATGELAGGGTSATNVLLGSVATLIVNGTYNCKYTTSNGPAIPTATWNPGSTVRISGYTSATGGPNGGMGQVFSNFIYSCSNQTSNANWSGTGPLTITGTLTIASTGTGSLIFGSTQGYNYVVNNFVQTGGTLNLNSGVASATPVLNVSGSFNQSGGTFTSTGNSSGNNAPVLHFNGTAGVQSVNFHNAAPVGPITYRISNPAGIILTGTGSLTGNFNLNNNGGVRVSTTAATPVSTTLNLNYTGSSALTFDAPGSVTATATVWPASGAPANVNLNTGNSGNVVTVPFSRVISGTLNMSSGDFDLGANDLTIGTSAAAPGAINYTAGGIRLGSGQLIRWYGITGLPTTPLTNGTAIGLYPISFGGLSRAVSLGFSNGTALSAGGTIAVGHNYLQGMTTGLSVSDGPYVIETRTNSSWTFAAGNGITATGTITARVNGTGLFVPLNPANLRLLRAASVVGNYVAGTGSTAFRSGLSLGDLTGAPLFIGAAAADIGGAYIAVNSGNWSAGSTWDVGSAPGNANEAFINPGVTVTADASANTARTLTVLAGGSLLVNNNSVDLAESLTNSGTVTVSGGALLVNTTGTAVGSISINGGTVNVTGGSLTLGPTGGSNRSFSNSGSLNVSGGNLVVNGSFSCQGGSSLSQSGGAISVDGNAGGVAANSVPQGTKIVNLLTPNISLTGGTFTIVDPHAGTGGTNTFEYNVANAHVNAGGTHIFRVGDGISTDAGGHASYAFSINTAISSGRFAMHYLVVNAGTAANSFFAQGASPMGVLGDLTVNSGGEFRQPAGQTVHVNGNIVNNAGGTFTSTGTGALVSFARYQSAVVTPSTNAQTVSGGGTFRNAVSATPAAKFTGITINNAAGGVTFNIGDVPYSGNFNFTLGKAIMGANILQQNAGAGMAGASQATGWVWGKFQKAAATGNLNHDYVVGDANYYTPVNISGNTATAGSMIVSTTPGDHPAVSSSTIAPAASVNRHYAIQMVNGMTLGSGTGLITFNWHPADADPGLLPAGNIVGQHLNAAWTYPAPSLPTATSIKASIPGTSVEGQYQVGQACAAIAISSQPQPLTLCSGMTATFSVAATGASLTYQWKKGGSDIPGATGATYTIPVVGIGDAGSYTVTVSSSCGAVATPVTSAVAALTVHAAPAISVAPQSQSICEGQPVTLGVTATGTGLSYQWLFGNAPIPGATAATYHIDSLLPAQGGNYTVMVSGTAPCAPAVSTVAAILVKSLPLAVTPAASLVFCAGGSVVLNATTGAGLNYQWLQNGSNIAGATSASYLATNSGSYAVLVTNTANGCSDTSAPQSVVANSFPTATITPAGTAAFCQNSSVLLSGNTGIGLSYQWRLGGSDIPGATAATYAANTTGSYTLVVSSGTNCATTSAPTLVSMNPLPSATVTAAGAIPFCTGGNVTLNAGTGTGFSYQWRLNGAAIPGATSGSYAASAAGAYKVVVTDANNCQDSSTAVNVTLYPLPPAAITAAGPTTICQGSPVTLNANTGTGLTHQWRLNTGNIAGATTASHAAGLAGSYTVRVTDANNCSNTSNAIAVTVNPVPVVNVTVTPSATVCAGQSVTMSVPSQPGQLYQWKLNTGNIPNATSNSYTASVAGSYTVVATLVATGCNATSAPVNVVINPLPAATISPAGPTAFCDGDSVKLNANTGAGLTYQWRRGGTDIPGATAASYTALTAGNYTVRVTNGNGCVQTSAPLAVTVNPVPQNTVSYSAPLAFCEGGAVVLSAATGANLGYQWSRGGNPIPGETNPDLIVTESGLYTVVVTNSATTCASQASMATSVTVWPVPQPVITNTGGVLSTGSFTTYQWFRNNAAIPGATGQSHTPNQNGTYSVTVTNGNNCSGVSPAVLLGNVGIRATAIGTLKIYPNPARGMLLIEAPVKVNAVLRDVTGRTLLQQEGARSLDMSGLAGGTYYLYLTDADGQPLWMEKVIKTE